MRGSGRAAAPPIRRSGPHLQLGHICESERREPVPELLVILENRQGRRVAAGGREREGAAQVIEGETTT